MTSAHTRREAFGAIGATALGGIAVAGFCTPEKLAQPAPNANDDRLIFLSGRIVEDQNRIEMLCEPYSHRASAIEPPEVLAQIDSLMSDITSRMKQIEVIKPITLAGLRAKAHAAAAYRSNPNPDDDDDVLIMRAMCRDLLELKV